MPAIDGELLGQQELEEEMYPDEGPFDFFKERLDAKLRKEQKFLAGGVEWERMPKDRFMKIGKIISKTDNAKLTNEEVMDRAAFKTIGVNYIKSLEKSNKFFEENPDKLLAYMEAHADANYVYSQLLGGLPDLEMKNDSPNNNKKEEKKSWFEKHKKGLTIGLLGLFGGIAVGVAYNEFVFKPEQRKAPYRQTGAIDEQINQFLSKYPQENGNATWVEFFKTRLPNSQLADKAFEVYNNLQEPLSILTPFYQTNSTLLNTINGNFLRDYRVTTDKYARILDALKLYQNLNLVDKNLLLPTVQGLDNITIAKNQLGLPLPDNVALWLFANCTQQPEGKNLVDFSQIVFESVDGNNYYLVPNPARETWTTAKILERINESGFDIKNHPEMFLGLNGKVITNNWCIFGNPYGINYIDKNLTPNDSSVLDLQMLQWNLYSQFAPQLGGADKPYNRDFPWYNSAELTALYPDKNKLRTNLFNLFYLPSATYSIKDQARKYGIEGTRISLTDANDEYQKIISLYPNGTVGQWNEDPRDTYYGWLGDRAGWGLKNTIGQFLGVNLTDVEFPMNMSEWLNLVKNNNGTDGYLTKNWKYWDLVKFITGYERLNRETGGELEGIQFIIPEVLRIAGFPTYHINIRPAPEGTSPTEWAVVVPSYISSKGVSPYLMDEGLIKDGIKETYTLVGGSNVYFMKRD